MNYQLVKKSSNIKIGKMPVLNADCTSCPDTCPFKNGGGCYSEQGFYTRLNREAIKTGKRGGSLKDALKELRKIKKGSIWRFGVDSDITGTNKRINKSELNRIINATKGTMGYGYTHKPDTPRNIAILKDARDKGLTINLSANGLNHADKLMKHGLPVATVLHSNTTKNLITPKGHKVVVCPATQSDSIQCITCKLCARSNRKVIIGFPSHGAGKNKVNKIFEVN